MAAISTLAIGVAPRWLISEGSFKTLVGVALLLAPLCAVLAAAKGRSLNAKQTTFRLGLVVWWYLLISDALFDRISNVQGMYQGQYSIDAYGEVITWVAAFVILTLITVSRPSVVLDLFSGPYRWASFFVLSCLAAVAYSPSPMYSAGWWFKLFVVLLTLRLCISGMESLEDVQSFLWASLMGLACAVLLPLSDALSDPLTLFEGVGGRLNADPAVLSVTSSCLLIVALVLNAVRKHWWLNVVILGSVLTMFLAMGKTGILAGVFSATAFFVLRKRAASGLLLLVGVALIGLLVITLVTPVGNYLTHYSGGSTLTGRTEIWHMAIPAIRQKPLLGHGYLSSKFMWLSATGPFAEVGHLHNGFLEVLYNNGIVGLVCLLGMHIAILSNLWFARRTFTQRRGTGVSGEAMNILIIGSFALYLNLLVNGFFTAAFGGRPNAHFMTFIAVLACSTGLRTLAERMQQRVPAMSATPRVPTKPFPVPAPVRYGPTGSPILG